MATQTLQISNVPSSETADDPDRHPVRDIFLLPGADR
jgi:hypothetical protein